MHKLGQDKLLIIFKGNLDFGSFRLHMTVKSINIKIQTHIVASQSIGIVADVP